MARSAPAPAPQISNGLHICCRCKVIYWGKWRQLPGGRILHYCKECQQAMQHKPPPLSHKFKID